MTRSLHTCFQTKNFNCNKCPQFEKTFKYYSQTLLTKNDINKLPSYNQAQYYERDIRYPKYIEKKTINLDLIVSLQQSAVIFLNLQLKIETGMMLLNFVKTVV